MGAGRNKVKDSSKYRVLRREFAFWGGFSTGLIMGGVEGMTKGIQIRNTFHTDRTDPYYQKIVKDSRQRYPEKTGYYEDHHIDPQYMGGDPKGNLIELDGAYHQMITNEFRKIQPYGSKRLDEAIRKIYHETSIYKIPSSYKIDFFYSF